MQERRLGIESKKLKACARRLKDEPALGLYSKAGYEVEKEDCILVSLWDDRRQLLSKFIPRRKESAAKSDAKAEKETEKFVAEYWN